METSQNQSRSQDRSQEQALLHLHRLLRSLDLKREVSLMQNLESVPFVTAQVKEVAAEEIQERAVVEGPKEQVDRT